MNITAIEVSTTHVTLTECLPEDCDTNRLFGGYILKFIDEKVSLVFVMFCGPVVVQIVQNLNTTIQMIQKFLS
jgi:acyl-CoA hydrolase